MAKKTYFHQYPVDNDFRSAFDPNRISGSTSTCGLLHSLTSPLKQIRSFLDGHFIWFYLGSFGLKHFGVNSVLNVCHYKLVLSSIRTLSSLKKQSTNLLYQHPSSLLTLIVVDLVNCPWKAPHC